MTHKLMAGAFCVALMLPAAARADQVSDLAALRTQMLQMQKDYANRMVALEKRLAKAEAEAKAAKQSASAASTTAKSAAASAKATAVRLAAVPPLPAPPAAAPATVVAAAPAQVPLSDQTAAMVEPPAAASGSTTPPSSLNAFNPGIAAVLNGFYFAASHD